MTRIFEHVAATLVAIMVMTMSFSAIVTVPVEPAVEAAAPILA